jgi:hypothetical protein
MFDRVRAAALAALQAQDELLLTLRDYNKSSDGNPLSGDDVELLRQLVFRKIYPVSAFGVLVKQDQTVASATLMARYLGSGVDADRGFGGFVFDLSTILSDLVEVRGEQCLLDLVKHPQFNKDLLNDSRFVECLSFALDIDAGEISAWIHQQSE